MSNGKAPAIQVQGLGKRFGAVQAVAGVDFEVAAGELFGFLGPNGAGKSTTINILTGLARADAGTVRIAGVDCARNPRAALHLTGVVPDESNLYPELSGAENLRFCGALYGLARRDREERAHALLTQFGLQEAAQRKFGGYSRGMKRRLTIAAGIIHRPSILFLDEPTTGLDVASARQVRNLIAQLHGEGTTIFLTTHYIEEAERLCDRIAFLVAGRIVHTEAVATLLEPVQQRQAVVLSLTPAEGDLASELQTAFPELDFQPAGDSAIRVESSQVVPIGPLIRFIEERGRTVTEARRLRPSLEEVFVKITGLQVEEMRRERGQGGRSE